MSKKNRRRVGALMIVVGAAVGLVAVPIAWGLGAVSAPVLVVGGVALVRQNPPRRRPRLRAGSHPRGPDGRFVPARWGR